jgi:hypothetical protein
VDIFNCIADCYETRYQGSLDARET